MDEKACMNCKYYKSMIDEYEDATYPRSDCTKHEMTISSIATFYCADFEDTDDDSRPVGAQVSHVALRKEKYKKLDENTAKELIDMIVSQNQNLSEEFKDYRNYKYKTKKGIYGYECKLGIYYNCEMAARYLYKEIVRAKQSG